MLVFNIVLKRDNYLNFFIFIVIWQGWSETEHDVLNTPYIFKQSSAMAWETESTSQLYQKKKNNKIKIIYIYIYIYILNILGAVRFSAVCTSRRRWLHRFDVGTEEMPPTTVSETFGGALKGADQCGQTDFSRWR